MMTYFVAMTIFSGLCLCFPQTRWIGALGMAVIICLFPAAFIFIGTSAGVILYYHRWRK